MSEETIHILHGAIGSHRDWSASQDFLELKGFLTDSHDLYRYLQQGDCRFEQFSKTFIQSLNRLKKKPKRQNLIGYSLGGRLALHLLLEQPLLWHKAVIVSAHTGLPESAEDEREARIESDNHWAELAADPDVAWSDFLSQWNQQGVLKSSADQNLGWLDRGELESVRNQVAASFRSWSLGLQQDLLEKMSTLTVPILWVVGENDLKFLEIAKRAVATLPNARLEVVKNAGHRVPWEQTDEFHSLISEWFEEEKL